MHYFFETYGCQMNIAESSAMKHILDEKKWTPSENADGADLIVINTCSVRATAETRLFGRLAHYKALKKKSPKPFSLLVAGCAASRLGDALIEKGADFTIGTEEKTIFPTILDEIERGEMGGAKHRIPSFTFSPSHYEEGQLRAFVPVMHGCNNFCSYCIVPFLRGREVSRAPADIEKEIKFLASKNVREITLLGQNVNSYWYEDEQGRAVTFPDLLDMIASYMEGTSIRWARFLSSHPKDFSDRTIEALQRNKAYCRHIHLCAQHGSNRILQAMNRRYTREQYVELVKKIKSAMPDISISTDILVGFPGETEEDFEEALTLMDEVRFLYAYMYHYNPREGTAAAALPNRVGEDVKRARLSRVIELQKQHTMEQLQSRLGRTELVLAEAQSKKSKDRLLCRSERDEAIVVQAPLSLRGAFFNVAIHSINGRTLLGTRRPHL
jgi:tRNA-2-methylthio-N6-dimethylallyladenosine synthase